MTLTENTIWAKSTTTLKEITKALTKTLYLQRRVTWLWQDLFIFRCITRWIVSVQMTDKFFIQSAMSHKLPRIPTFYILVNAVAFSVNVFSVIVVVIYTSGPQYILLPRSSKKNHCAPYHKAVELHASPRTLLKKKKTLVIIYTL